MGRMLSWYLLPLDRSALSSLCSFFSSSSSSSLTFHRKPYLWGCGQKTVSVPYLPLPVVHAHLGRWLHHPQHRQTPTQFVGVFPRMSRSQDYPYPAAEQLKWPNHQKNLVHWLKSDHDHLHSENADPSRVKRSLKGVTYPLKITTNLYSKRETASFEFCTAGKLVK